MKISVNGFDFNDYYLTPTTLDFLEEKVTDFVESDNGGLAVLEKQNLFDFLFKIFVEGEYNLSNVEIAACLDSQELSISDIFCQKINYNDLIKKVVWDIIRNIELELSINFKEDM